MPEPPPSRLRRLLKEHPQERSRLAAAVVSLLAVGLVALAALGGLILWHLIRRGRLIRDGLSPPRKVRLPEIEVEAKPTGAEGAEVQQGPGPS